MNNKNTVRKWWLYFVLLILLGIFIPTIIQYFYYLGNNTGFALSNVFESKDILSYVTSLIGVLATFFIGILTFSLQKQLNQIEKNRDELSYTPRVTCIAPGQQTDLTFFYEATVKNHQLFSNKLILGKNVPHDGRYHLINIDLKLISITDIFPDEVFIDFLELFIDNQDRYQFHSIHKNTFIPIPSGANNELFISIFLYIEQGTNLCDKILNGGELRIDSLIDLRTYGKYHSRYRWIQGFGTDKTRKEVKQEDTPLHIQLISKPGIISRWTNDKNL